MTLTADSARNHLALDVVNHFNDTTDDKVTCIRVTDPIWELLSFF